MEMEAKEMVEGKDVNGAGPDPNPFTADGDDIIVVAPQAKPQTPDHPPYAEMVRVALLGLDEENGSTEAAISAYIVSAFSGLPPGHANLLPYYLRKLVASGFLAAPFPGQRYLLLSPPPSPQNPNPNPNPKLTSRPRRQNPDTNPNPIVNPNPNLDPSSKPSLTSGRRRRRSQSPDLNTNPNTNPNPNLNPSPKPSLTSGSRRRRRSQNPDPSPNTNPNPSLNPSSKPSLTSGRGRGRRGRPPKKATAAAEAAATVVGMGAAAAVEAVVAPVRRGRGRPRTLPAVAPVRGGRGRPRKRAAVAAAEREVSVAMKEEKGYGDEPQKEDEAGVGSVA